VVSSKQKNKCSVGFTAHLHNMSYNCVVYVTDRLCLFFYTYRDTEVIENGLDSPLDELEHMSVLSEIPAYKSANQELAGVLKNLRRMEQHIKGK